MKATVHMTDEVMTVGGVPARIWEGVTEHGINLQLLVVGVAVRSDGDAVELDRATSRHQHPSTRHLPFPILLTEPRNGA